MSRRFSIAARGPLFAIALGALAGLASAGIGQQETTVTVIEGAEPQELSYGEHTSNAVIDQTVDFDYFVFSADAGDEIRITVDGLTRYLDPRVEVFGPGGYSNSKQCAGGYYTCSFMLEDTLPESGVYTIIVSDAGSDGTGSYTLQLERVPPTWPTFLLPYNFTSYELVSPTTDHDFLRFHGEAGSRVRIVMDGLTRYFDPLVEVFGPDQELVTSQHCAGGYYTCSFNLEIDLTMTGTYLLVVSDAGHDGTGYYNLSVNCLYGCPTFTAVLPRNGTGANPDVYSSAWPPAISGTWVGQVDVTSQPGELTGVFFFRGSLDPGLMIPWGELLVDLSSPFVAISLAFPPAGSNIATHMLRLPADPRLVGTALSSQALIMGSSKVLTNAIDYRLGW